MRHKYNNPSQVSWRYIAKELKPACGDIIPSMIPEGVSMSEFAIADQFKNVADDNAWGTVAVFLTINARFKYAVDTEGYGSTHFFTADKLAFTHARRRAS
jgi:hypothetical protein